MVNNHNNTVPTSTNIEQLEPGKLYTPVTSFYIWTRQRTVVIGSGEVFCVLKKQVVKGCYHSTEVRFSLLLADTGEVIESSHTIHDSSAWLPEFYEPTSENSRK